MKLKDEWILDGDKLIHHKQHDITPTLARVQEARDAGAHQTGEMRHVGTVPGWLINEWCKEAGVRWNDNEARKEIVKKKMLSGEFSALRNWQGTY